LDGERFKKFRKVKDVPFEELRDIQKQTLLTMKKAFADATERGVRGPKFMCVMPTGTGKTVVIALAPFMVDADKVLVVAPGVPIRKQLEERMDDYLGDSKTHPIAKTGKIDIKVSGYNPGGKMPNSTKMVVTHVQELTDSKKGSRGNDGPSGSSQEEASDGMVLKDKAKEMLNKLKPDLVIMDEGHHVAADSWEVLIKESLDSNESCKFMFLTATPQRGDGKTFGIEERESHQPQFFFVATRKAASTDGIIKKTESKPIQRLSEGGPKYTAKPHVLNLVRPAAKKLSELRNSVGGVLVRMLVTTTTNKAANEIAEWINADDVIKAYGFRAASFTGDTKTRNLKEHEKTKELFEAHKSPFKGKHIVDIAVQNRMFAEGYDNPLISISVMCCPIKSPSMFNQQHGRALRIDPGVRRMVTQKTASPQLLNSFVYFHADEEASAVVNAYVDFQDEDPQRILETLFAPKAFKSLKMAHRKLGKLTSANFFNEMKSASMFDDYHQLYEQRRSCDSPDDDNGWDPIPAEYIVDLLFPSLSHPASGEDWDHFQIVDFGCGRDHLFESCLLEKLKEPNVLRGGGKVTVAALDVQMIGERSLAGLNNEMTGSEKLVFEVKSTACDYADTDTWFRPENGKFDAAIFCLSFMASDSWEVGLIAAARVLKPSGRIYVSIDHYKVGFTHRMGADTLDKQLKESSWVRTFVEKSGFEVERVFVHGKPTFVYLTLKKKDQTEDEIREKLSGFKLKDVNAASDIANIIERAKTERAKTEPKAGSKRKKDSESDD